MKLILKSTINIIMAAASIVVSFAQNPTAENVTIEKSKTYGCKSNGAEVAVYEFGPGKAENICLANIYKTGKQKIVLTVPENIQKFSILPKSAGIKGKAKGNTLSFTARGRKKLHIQVNDLPCLELTTDDPEDPASKPTDKATYHFEPGEHVVGDIVLKSGESVRIEEGAIVHGDIVGEGDNITISGRGILHGTTRIEYCNQLNVRDVTICNSVFSWTNALVCCTNSSFRNVKVYSCAAKWSQDGINPVSCKNFTIEDCFIRTIDDCIAIKSFVCDKKGDMGSHNITVKGCTLVGWNCADGITMGFELNGGEVKDILVQNCDILKAKGYGATGGHSAFSIVCDGTAEVHHVTFDDIRVTSDIDPKNLELIITNGKLYGDEAPGQMHDITLRNIQWSNDTLPLIIEGREEHVIRNVVFENCSIAGKPIRSKEDAPFKINYAENILFKKRK